MGSTVTIRGASDDLVEVEGNVEGCDEYNAEDATFIVVGQHPDRGLAMVRVRVVFDAPDSNGLWTVALTAVPGFPTLVATLDSEADQDQALVLSDVQYVGRLHT